MWISTGNTGEDYSGDPVNFIQRDVFPLQGVSHFHSYLESIGSNCDIDIGSRTTEQSIPDKPAYEIGGDLLLVQELIYPHQYR
jgi:hypothetical protein